MVSKKNIDDTFEYLLLRNNIQDIVEKELEVIKCSHNKATDAGDGAVVHMANDPDGEKVPKRRLQHKGFTEDGTDMGYIADITYPNGTKIDYYNGKITLKGIDGVEDGEFPMGFYDNFDKDGNHITEGSANGLFKQQWRDIPPHRKSFLMNYMSFLKRGSLARKMKELDEAGIAFERHSTKSKFHGTPLGRLILGRIQMNSLIRETRADGQNLVVGEQVEKLGFKDLRKVHTSSDNFTSTSVGFLNDKTLNVRDTVTGESRSISGHENNWDNTTKIYTLIRQGDGSHAVYLGYGQNVAEGVFDNSANPHNELTWSGGQKYKKVLVDTTNNIIIQVPVNDGMYDISNSGSVNRT